MERLANGTGDKSKRANKKTLISAIFKEGPIWDNFHRRPL
jgi:hypothetical protein